MRIRYALCALFAGASLFAQQPDMALMGDLKPRNIGPGGMSGRVTAIDVVSDQPDIMFVGTASGGLWKSTSAGLTWESVTDSLPVASIGAVAIDQGNPSIIWAGTGEGNPRNSLNGGYGIYKSLDGGKTWKCMGLEKTRHIHRIKIDPTNSQTVYVAAIGSPWGAHEERGIYKTTDGGNTWNKILYANPNTGAADLVMDPKNPNKLFAALWEHKRTPWFFESGGKGSGLFRSVDGGNTWTKITAAKGLPEGDLGRIGLAIAPSNPEVVYALIESKKNALYKSTDGGYQWTKVNDKEDDIGNRPFYYSEIHVDPENENRLYSIFTYVNVSDDGGKSFRQLMPAYGVTNGVHPDHHAWWIHPENSSFMMDGNDGGLNISYDKGKTWRFVNNLPVAQFYHISVDNDFPYNVYGGMQDNGSWKGPAYVWKDQGIRNSYWQEIAFGDGFDVVPDLQDSRYGFAMSQEGYVSRFDAETGNNYLVRPTHPDPKVELRFNWNSAIAQDPFDPSTIYFGSQFVHKSTDKGLSWSIISPDLTSNDPEKQKQGESGGITMDATGAENHTTLLVIEPSRVEKGVIWTGSDDGKVHITQNGGQDWKDITKNIKGLPQGSWIAQIKASRDKAGEALLVANDYRRNNYTPYAYRTTDYGKSWERIVDEKDVQRFALSILEDPVNPNLMFLGTDDGLHISLDKGKTWSKWTSGFPTVPTADLAIQEREGDLVIGTFGRAAWVLDDLNPLRALAGEPELTKDSLRLFTPPTAYLASYQQPTGSRFGADALYQGENRRKGAMITYFIRPSGSAADEKATEDSKKKDSILLQIYEGDRLIRTLTEKTPEKAGFHRLYWDMREKGGQVPSRTYKSYRKERAGVEVKPGTYRLKMVYKGHSSESEITVKPDPRLPFDQQGQLQCYQAGSSLQQWMQTSTDAVDQLLLSKKKAAELSARLKELDKEKYKVAIEHSKAIQDSIDPIIDLFIGKEDKRQGIVKEQEDNVLARIQKASSYVGSRPSGLTATEDRLMEQARNSYQAAIQEVNTFYSGPWQKYREEMEQIEWKLFEETKTFTAP